MEVIAINLLPDAIAPEHEHEASVACYAAQCDSAAQERVGLAWR